MSRKDVSRTFRILYEMILSGAMTLAVLLRLAAGQDTNCDFTQMAEPGQPYYVYSPGYPNNYTGARQCRWIGVSPSGYRLRLNCPEITLPASTGCSVDRMLISRSGDPQLNNADVYCGRGSTTAVSTNTRISIGLITSARTPGGKFYCQMTTEASTPTPACSCGYKKSNRIVGGQETGVNEYPMMAAVVYRAQQRVRCGGTIIDKRYILTAAHCVENKQAGDIAVIVGEHDTTTGDSPATKGFTVERIVIHPRYSSSNYDYDIAVLRVSGDIAFSDRVGPVCLPFRFTNADFTGSRFTLLGWGTEFFGGPTSNTLKKVDVDVISQSACRRAVPSLTDQQICTYTPGKDACQDDSGGPALWTDPSTGLLFSAGVVSFGRSCAEDGQPGINTRVPGLLDWIVTNTPGGNYCSK